MFRARVCRNRIDARMRLPSNAGLVNTRVRISWTRSNISSSVLYRSRLMPYSSRAFGVLPPLWSKAAKKPRPSRIFSSCVVSMAPILAPARRMREPGLRACRGSELAASPGVEDDLGHQVPAEADLLGDLVGPQALLVVQQREPLLPLAPRLTADLRGGGGCGPLPWRRWTRLRGGGGRRRRDGRSHGRAERPAPLVVVLAAGDLFTGVLVQDHVLLSRLVHPDGDHRQALRVLLLALGRHAVVVLLGALGMEFPAAGNALIHSFRKTANMVRLFQAGGVPGPLRSGHDHGEFSADITEKS